jgi:hypothetical protein
MRKFIVAIMQIAIAHICMGQNDLPNRSTFVLRLVVDNDNFYVDTVAASPYVVKNTTLQIYPGEKVFLEMEEDSGKIKSVKTVRQNLNPDKTVEISFFQNIDGKKNNGMMLKIDKNPFKQILKYKVTMYLMKYKKWAPTSVLPIQPGIGSYETWPDAIVTIALYGWDLK